jgi:hypothetical protein
MNADADLHVRSYGADTGADRHTYAQLVLPLGGAVLLDIEGRQDRLDPLRGACIAPGAWHAQRGVGSNESLILDIDPATLAHPAWDRLFERPFMPLGPGARKLVEFMGACPAPAHGWLKRCVRSPRSRWRPAFPTRAR